MLITVPSRASIAANSVAVPYQQSLRFSTSFQILFDCKFFKPLTGSSKPRSHRRACPRGSTMLRILPRPHRLQPSAESNDPLEDVPYGLTALSPKPGAS